MKVIVLGAGVVGVTTAYRLAAQGHAVTVIDRRQALASEASHANGGQLSYDFASPMGAPGVLTHLIAYLLGRDEAFKIRLTPDLDYLIWGARFLANCLPGPARANSSALARLAQSSQKALSRLIEETNVGFNHRRAGKLVLFDKTDDFARAIGRAQAAQQKGRDLEPFTTQECLDLEPALERWAGPQIVGGLYAPHDDVGDARMFTQSIGAVAADRYGVQFLLGKHVDKVITRNGMACGVGLGGDGADAGALEADAVVVCMGVNAPRLLRPLRIAAPIEPICGYSITAPIGGHAPHVAITDLGRKMVYSKIGAQMRIAGFADAGLKVGNSPAAQAQHFAKARLKTLTARAQATLPDAADYQNIASHWIGVRPSTPNSLPIVSETSVKGLFLNIGHGMFGWTLSARCAEIIADKLAQYQYSCSPN